MKQFGTPPSSKRILPLSTNPLFLSNFFMTPLFVQILKTRNPPLILGGRKLCILCFHFEISIFFNISFDKSETVVRSVVNIRATLCTFQPQAQKNKKVLSRKNFLHFSRQIFLIFQDGY